MGKLSRTQAKEIIEAYLAQHPGASFSEIGNLLGVSKQRAYQLLTLVRGADTPLTDHELKILRRIASGNSNKEIAELLNLSEKTIKNHITVILAKLGASNRTETVVTAIQQGLISLGEVKPAETASM